MNAFKIFICGFMLGILFSVLLRLCYLFGRRLSGVKINDSVPGRYNEQAAEENRRLTTLEQREAELLTEAEQDNRNARTLIKRAKDILHKYDNTCDNTDIVGTI